MQPSVDVRKAREKKSGLNVYTYLAHIYATWRRQYQIFSWRSFFFNIAYTFWMLFPSLLNASTCITWYIDFVRCVRITTMYSRFYLVRRVPIEKETRIHTTISIHLYVHVDECVNVLFFVAVVLLVRFDTALKSLLRLIETISQIDCILHPLVLFILGIER